MPSKGHEILAHTWFRYRHNLPRHITIITRHIESTLRDRLVHNGYPEVAVNFSQPMTLLSTHPARLTDLAKQMGISKQLCAQQIKPIVDLGYIQRVPSLVDRRSSQLELTRSGRKLVRDSLRQLDKINTEYTKLTKISHVDRLQNILLELGLALGAPEAITMQKNSIYDSPFTALIGPLNHVVHKDLMQLTISKGHTDLQMSFGQVLTSIDLRGTRVSTIAEANGVTNQAIFRIVRELEQREYISRFIDKPSGKKMIAFTAKGLQLITDTTSAADAVEDRMKSTVGEKTFVFFRDTMKNIYDALGLEDGVFGDYDESVADRILKNDSPPRSSNTVSPADLLAFIAELLSEHLETPDLIQTAPDGRVSLSQASLKSLSYTQLDANILEEHCIATLGKRSTSQLKSILKDLAVQF